MAVFPAYAGLIPRRSSTMLIGSIGIPRLCGVDSPVLGLELGYYLRIPRLCGVDSYA